MKRDTKMSAKQFFVAQKADKQFLKLPLQIQTKILQAYHRVKENPLSGIKLHGELTHYYKYRVGDYRIVYYFDQKTSTVGVVKIEHRQGVYK